MSDPLRVYPREINFPHPSSQIKDRYRFNRFRNFETVRQAGTCREQALLILVVQVHILYINYAVLVQQDEPPSM